LREEGWRHGLRDGAIQATRKTLLRLLKIQFDQVPAEIKAAIKKTANLKQLEEWLDRLAGATTLEKVGIRKTT